MNNHTCFVCPTAKLGVGRPGTSNVHVEKQCVRPHQQVGMLNTAAGRLPNEDEAMSASFTQL